HALGGAFLVAGEHEQLRRKAADGLRRERPGTHEGQGAKELWVPGGESRPIARRPCGEMGLVDSQVLEQLENPFLDRHATHGRGTRMLRQAWGRGPGSFQNTTWF